MLPAIGVESNQLNWQGFKPKPRPCAWLVLAGYWSMGAEAGLVLHVLCVGWCIGWCVTVDCVFERLCLICEDVVNKRPVAMWFNSHIMKLYANT